MDTALPADPPFLARPHVKADVCEPCREPPGLHKLNGGARGKRIETFRIVQAQKETRLTELLEGLGRDRQDIEASTGSDFRRDLIFNPTAENQTTETTRNTKVARKH